MTENTTLGVCIPTYKRPEQLLETVRSVIASGAAVGIPVFIADDAADDTNEAAVALLKAEYPFVYHLRNEVNLGIDGNILHSVDICTCAYAWILGEDDRMVPGAVARVLAAIETAPAEEPWPFIYVNYAAVSNDFASILKPRSLPLTEDATRHIDAFLSHEAWSMGFIGACVVNRELWGRVEKQKYIGTWFAHVGTIMELCCGHRICMIEEPLIHNRCGTAEAFTWTGSMADVLDGWRRVMGMLAPLYADAVLDASVQAFRHAHGLDRIKFLAYARAGGGLTPASVRQNIRGQRFALSYRCAAEIIARLPVGLFVGFQRIWHVMIGRRLSP